MESLFSGIDSCSLTAVSSARVLNFIHLFLLSLLIFFFQIDRLELSFTDSVSVSVSVYVIPFPDSGFHLLRPGDGGHYGYG